MYQEVTQSVGDAAEIWR